MTLVKRDEPRVPPRDRILSKHPRGNWILRRRVDEWAQQATRDMFIASMEDFVRTRSWARDWKVTERFQNNAINRAIPRGPAKDEPPTDQEILDANLLPILDFVITRDRDGALIETSLPLPLVNGTDLPLAIARVEQSLDLLQKMT